ncbi:tRNA methyl transferase [Cokeromyces recurvatus]|uniref:tRNA methyl transferase n=1 Tax=Cokeromyces recurvatus TaxID=90255 RepID=UPI00221EC690|nr:tRNA methyl transferase [Cokeromyces recurvatus]KAI7901086.1 tRNA methyl transferase [Cokeromyces recurvatus]
MSGGVDSSVSAALLKQQGFDVQGIYMRNWDTSDERGVCTSREDWEDVQKVCHHLDIPCQQVNFVKEYWQDVFEKTLEDYAHGLTPNPDIACNSSIKFGALLNKIPKDAWFATGHYCRSTPEGKLLRGLERKKDQSYYLSNVPEEAISRTLFPLGDFTSKAAVKDLAHQLGLGGIAAKKESMGICFVGQRKKFADFLKEYIDLPPGPAINLENGQVIGEHQGLYGYTIGQASRICYRSDKWFVAEKDIKENKLICVPGSNHPALFHMGCRARDWKWIHHAAPSKLDINGEIEVEAQIRYRQSSEKAILSIQSNRHPTIIFKRPIRAIARGQQVVVWDQDWCLGGGVIEEVLF